MKLFISILIILIGVTIKPYYTMYYGGIVLFIVFQFALDEKIKEMGL